MLFLSEKQNKTEHQSPDKGLEAIKHVGESARPAQVKDPPRDTWLGINVFSYFPDLVVSKSSDSIFSTSNLQLLFKVRAIF